MNGRSMCQIIPSLLVDSQAEFKRRLKLAEGDTELVHVDVLDDTLVPGHSWHDAAAIGKLKTKAQFELHLMVENPLAVVETWRAHVPGLKRAIVHAEMSHPAGAVIRALKNWGLEAGLALNPESPLEEIATVARMISQLTLMGVRPGASGQRFLGASVLTKIRDAKKRWPELKIEVDGGATADLVNSLLSAGCDRIVAANAIFGAQDPAAAFALLTRLASSDAA